MKMSVLYLENTLTLQGSTIICTVKRGLITAVDINARTDRLKQSVPAMQSQLLNQRYSDFFLIRPTDCSSPLKDIM